MNIRNIKWDAFMNRIPAFSRIEREPNGVSETLAYVDRAGKPSPHNYGNGVVVRVVLDDGNVEYRHSSRSAFPVLYTEDEYDEIEERYSSIAAT